jgi:hypothetical protein
MEVRRDLTTCIARDEPLVGMQMSYPLAQLFITRSPRYLSGLSSSFCAGIPDAFERFHPKFRRVRMSPSRFRPRFCSPPIHPHYLLCSRLQDLLLAGVTETSLDTRVTLMSQSLLKV